MTIYEDLKERIRLISYDESDFKHLYSLTLRHFEGVYVRDMMPDELWRVIVDWEMEQRES